MTRTLTLLAAGAIWAYLMSELVKRELLPYYEYQAPPSYRTLLQGREQPYLERWSIWVGPERIGESETLFEPGSKVRRIRTRTSYDAKKTMPPEATRFFSGPLRVELWTDIHIDDSFQLSEIEMKGRTIIINGTVRGCRRGDKMALSYTFPPLLRGDRVIDLPKDTTLSDVALPMHGVGRLRVNKKWQFNTIGFDPADGLKVTPLFALVEDKTSRIWNGKPVDVFRVDVKKRPTEDTTVLYQVWVNEEGQALEQRHIEGSLEMKCLLEEVRTLGGAEAGAWPWQPPEDP